MFHRLTRRQKFLLIVLGVLVSIVVIPPLMLGAWLQAPLEHGIAKTLGMPVAVSGISGGWRSPVTIDEVQIGERAGGGPLLVARGVATNRSMAGMLFEEGALELTTEELLVYIDPAEESRWWEAGETAAALLEQPEAVGQIPSSLQIGLNSVTVHDTVGDQIVTLAGELLCSDVHGRSPITLNLDRSKSEPGQLSLSVTLREWGSPDRIVDVAVRGSDVQLDRLTSSLPQTRGPRGTVTNLIASYRGSDLGWEATASFAGTGLTMEPYLRDPINDCEVEVTAKGVGKNLHAGNLDVRFRGGSISAMLPTGVDLGARPMPLGGNLKCQVAKAQDHPWLDPLFALLGLTEARGALRLEAAGKTRLIKERDAWRLDGLTSKTQLTGELRVREALLNDERVRDVDLRGFARDGVLVITQGQGVVRGVALKGRGTVGFGTTERMTDFRVSTIASRTVDVPLESGATLSATVRGEVRCKGTSTGFRITPQIEFPLLVVSVDGDPRSSWGSGQLNGEILWDRVRDQLSFEDVRFRGERLDIHLTGGGVDRVSHDRPVALLKGTYRVDGPPLEDLLEPWPQVQAQAAQGAVDLWFPLVWESWGAFVQQCQGKCSARLSDFVLMGAAAKEGAISVEKAGTTIDGELDLQLEGGMANWTFSGRSGDWTGQGTLTNFLVDTQLGVRDAVTLEARADGTVDLRIKDQRRSVSAKGTLRNVRASGRDQVIPEVATSLAYVEEDNQRTFQHVELKGPGVDIDLQRDEGALKGRVAADGPWADVLLSRMTWWPFRTGGRVSVEGLSLSPEGFPTGSLDLSARDLEWEGARFSTMELKLDREGDHLNIRTGVLSAENGNLRVTGTLGIHDPLKHTATDLRLTAHQMPYRFSRAAMGGEKRRAVERTVIDSGVFTGTASVRGDGAQTALAIRANLQGILHLGMERSVGTPFVLPDLAVDLQAVFGNGGVQCSRLSVNGSGMTVNGSNLTLRDGHASADSLDVQLPIEAWRSIFWELRARSITLDPGTTVRIRRDSGAAGGNSVAVDIPQMTLLGMVMSDGELRGSWTGNQLTVKHSKASFLKGVASADPGFTVCRRMDA